MLVLKTIKEYEVVSGLSNSAIRKKIDNKSLSSAIYNDLTYVIIENNDIEQLKHTIKLKNSNIKTLKETIKSIKEKELFLEELKIDKERLITQIETLHEQNKSLSNQNQEMTKSVMETSKTKDVLYEKVIGFTLEHKKQS